MNLYSLLLTFHLFSLFFLSSFANEELWKDCWGTDLLYYEKECCDEAAKLDDTNFHCLDKIPQIDGYAKLNGKLHQDFENMETCKQQQQNCSTNMTFLELREITGDIEQQTEELAQQGVETLQPKSETLTDISNGLLGNLSMTKGSLTFLGNSTINLKTLDIKQIAVPSTLENPAEMGFLSSESGTLNIVSDVQLDPKEDDVQNRHLNVNLKSNETKLNGSTVHVKGSELAVLDGLAANITFKTNNASIYKGKACLGNNDCQSNCKVDSNCKGYSRIENTRPVLDTTRHEYELVTKVTYGAKTCIGDEDCALQCTNDTSCLGFSILELFVQNGTNFQTIERYQYGAPYKTGCSAGNSSNEAECIYSVSNISVDATVTEYDCRNFARNTKNFTFSGDLNTVVAPSTCIIDTTGQRVFYNSAPSNVACGAIIQVAAGDVFTSLCLLKTGSTWLQPATISKQKEDAFIPTLFVTFEYGLEGNTSIDDAYYSHEKIVDKSPALNATVLNMLKGLTATAAQINKLADMNVNFGNFGALDSLDINPGDLNVLKGVNSSLSKTELDKLVGLTANSSELNVLLGVNIALNSTHLSHLIGLQSSASELNVLKGVNVKTFSAKLQNQNQIVDPLDAFGLSSTHQSWIHTNIDVLSVGTTVTFTNPSTSLQFTSTIKSVISGHTPTRYYAIIINDDHGIHVNGLTDVKINLNTALGKAELDLLVGLDVNSMVCSDPTKTTELDCLYEFSQTGSHDTSITKQDCQALATSSGLTFISFTYGTSTSGPAFGCFKTNDPLYLYFQEKDWGHTCDDGAHGGYYCVKRANTTRTLVPEKNLNVMKGVSSSLNASELNRLVGLTAEASELNVLKGVDTSLGHAELDHLVGLQSNASHLNVLKGVSTDLGKAELDLLVGLDVNAGDLNVMKGVSSSLNASELSALVGLTAKASELNVLEGTFIVSVQQLTLGAHHTCSLFTNGKLKCWGRNFNGQLGYGDTNSRGDEANEMGKNLPYVNLGTGKTAKQISLGGAHTCALLNDHTVKCWGMAATGQLGYEDSNLRGDEPNEMGDNLPIVNLGAGKTAKEIVAGHDHTCAILDDDTVKCWGYAHLGRLGYGTTHVRGDDPNEMGDNLPVVDLGTAKTVKQLVAGFDHTCAILNDDSVKCWGYNAFGQLGYGDSDNRGDQANEMGDNLLAVDLGSGKTAKQISAGGFHTCAILNDDSVKCWGDGGSGRLGYGDRNNRGVNPNEMGDNLPTVDLGSGKTAKYISAGELQTCVLLNDDSVKCWGYGSYGRLGLGNTQNRGDAANTMGDNLPAIDFGAGKTARQIHTAKMHTCALLNDGTLKCWGYGAEGRLGYGDAVNRGHDINDMGDNLPVVDLGEELGVGSETSSSLQSTDLNHLVGLQTNASELNVLKGASTDLGKAELDLLVGLNVNAGDLNVMKGVSASLSKTELDKLVGLTAEASELNVLDGVEATLGHAELDHLIGLQSNASHLNVLKDANTALGKAELDLLVGLDVNAGDLNVMKGVSASLSKTELDKLVGLTADADALNGLSVSSSELNLIHDLTPVYTSETSEIYSGNTCSDATDCASKCTVDGNCLGYSEIMAPKPNGGIVAWGSSSQGGSNEPTTGTYVSIFSNPNAFAALKADGSITAWGSGSRGGTGGGPSGNDPPSDDGYVTIASAESAFAALKADGSISAWGWIGAGGSDAPTDNGYTKIVATANAFAALKNDGTISVWGDASQGGSGAPTTGTYVSIFSTETAFAAIRDDKSITAWGGTSQGGSGAPTDNGYVNMFSNDYAFAALKEDGSITAWGHSTYGGSGAPTTGTYVSVVSAAFAFAAIKADGSITAWGDSDKGGSGEPTDNGYTSIFSNKYTFAALKNDGSVKVWGASHYGGCTNGVGEIDVRCVPHGLSGVVKIFSTNTAFAALKTDGSIVAWGAGGNGGMNEPTDDGYVNIFSTSAAFAAIKADGSITAWGEAGDGVTGAPTTGVYATIVATEKAFAAIPQTTTYAYGSTVNSGSAVSQTKSFGKTKASKIVSADGKGKVTFTENVTVQGNVNIPAGNLKLGSQTLTVTSAELNKLLLNTNLTATTSEINTLDTVVATAAELNKMHGFTGTTEQLNHLDVTTAGQSEANKVLTTSENHGLVTFNKKVTAEDVLDAKVLELNSVAVTSTASELNVLDGISATTDELNRVDLSSPTDIGKTLASKALVTDSSGDMEMNDVTVSDSLRLSKDKLEIDGVAITATASEINVLSGVTATASELSILDGVTSSTDDLNVLKGALREVTIVSTGNADLSLSLSETECEAYATKNSYAYSAPQDNQGFASQLPTGCVLRKEHGVYNQVLFVENGGQDCGYFNVITPYTIYYCLQNLVVLNTADIKLLDQDLTTSKVVVRGATVEMDSVLPKEVHASEVHVGSVPLTVSAAELNVLGGVSTSLATADLEKVIGLTASAAEMNLMDGVTASTADLNALDVAVKVDATSKVALQNVTLQKTLSLNTQYEAVASTVYEAYGSEMKTVPGSVPRWFYFHTEGNNGHVYDGNFYAISAASDDRHILKLSSDGTFDRSWLNHETAFGQGLSTYGFTGDAVGNLYVGTFLKIFKIDIAAKTATAILTETQDTLTTMITRVAASKDGKYVFYFKENSGQKHLYQLDTSLSTSTKIVDSVEHVYAMQFINDNLYYSTKSCYNCDTVGTISKLTNVGAAFVDLASVQKTDYTTKYDVGTTRFNFDLDSAGNFYILDKDGVMHKHAPDFTEIASGIGGFDASTCEKRLDNNGFVHVSSDGSIYTKLVFDDSNNANGCQNYGNRNVMAIISTLKCSNETDCRKTCAGDSTCGGYTEKPAIFVQQLDLGYEHTCSLASDGTVKCWGRGDNGRLGLGDTYERGSGPNEMGTNLQVVDLGTGKTVKQISAGMEHSCAILNDDTLKCWGSGSDGRLGYGNTFTKGDNANEMGDNLATVNLGAGVTAKKVAAGGAHTCAILNDDTVKCWGFGGQGRLGYGNTDTQRSPPSSIVDLGTGKKAKQIVAASKHTCAILNDDTVKCWGYGDKGRLGSGDQISRGDGANEMGDNLAVVDLGTGKTAKQLAAGQQHTCAILNDDTVKCWGDGSGGRLGYGNADDQGDGANEMGDNLAIVNLGTGKTAKQIAAAEEHSCAILDDDTVKCWGKGNSGQLGYESSGYEMTPRADAINLGAGKTAKQIYANGFFTCAILNDDTVKCWGANYRGNLGYGDTINRGTDPNQMGDNLPVVDIGGMRPTTFSYGSASNSSASGISSYKKLQLGLKMDDPNIKVCSDPTKTTEADCLYALVDTGLGLSDSDSKFLSVSECHALAGLTINGIAIRTGLSGSSDYGTGFPHGCFVKPDGQIYHNSALGGSCSGTTTDPAFCVRKSGYTWDVAPPVVVLVSASDLNKMQTTSTQAELNVMSGVTSETAEFSIIKDITASIADRNMMHEGKVLLTDGNARVAHDDVTMEDVDAKELHLVEFPTTSVSYAGTSCSDQTECQKLCMLDSACEGYSGSNGNFAYGPASGTSGGFEKKPVKLTLSVDSLNTLAGTSINVAELNKVSGLTVTTAEVNKLDGLLATTEDLNIAATKTVKIEGGPIGYEEVAGSNNWCDSTLGWMAATNPYVNVPNGNELTLSLCASIFQDLYDQGGVCYDAGRNEVLEAATESACTGTWSSKVSQRFVFGMSTGTLTGNSISNQCAMCASDSTYSSPSWAGSYDIYDVTPATAIVNLPNATIQELDAAKFKLRGVELKAAELNTVSSVTSTMQELNIMDGVTANTAELNKMAGMTASKADLDALRTSVVKTDASGHVTVTKIQGGASSELNVTTPTISGITITASAEELNRIPDLPTVSNMNKIHDVTATTEEINILDDIDVSTADLNLLASSDRSILVADQNGLVTVSQDADFKGADINITNFKLGNVFITASLAEMSTMDEISVNVQELNKLKGVATGIDMNVLDDLTASQTDLNGIAENALKLGADKTVTLQKGELAEVDVKTLKVASTAVTSSAMEINVLDGIPRAKTDVAVAFDQATYDVCELDTATVTWNGYHNIQEVTSEAYDSYTSGQGHIGTAVHNFENSGTVKVVSGLHAEKGTTRYFLCTSHPNSKFKTTCTRDVLSASELSILDGVTASTEEINKLHNVTATAADINTLASTAVKVTDMASLGGSATLHAANIDSTFKLASATVTSTATELNILDGVTVTHADLNELVDVNVDLTGADLNKFDSSRTINPSQVKLSDLNRLHTLTDAEKILATDASGDTALKDVDVVGELDVSKLSLGGTEIKASELNFVYSLQQELGAGVNYKDVLNLVDTTEGSSEASKALITDSSGNVQLNLDAKAVALEAGTLKVNGAMVDLNSLIQKNDKYAALTSPEYLDDVSLTGLQNLDSIAKTVSTATQLNLSPHVHDAKSNITKEQCAKTHVYDNVTLVGGCSDNSDKTFAECVYQYGKCVAANEDLCYNATTTSVTKTLITPGRVGTYNEQPTLARAEEACSADPQCGFVSKTATDTYLLGKAYCPITSSETIIKSMCGSCSRNGLNKKSDCETAGFTWTSQYIEDAACTGTCYGSYDKYPTFLTYTSYTLNHATDFDLGVTSDDGYKWACSAASPCAGSAQKVCSDNDDCTTVAYDGSWKHAQTITSTAFCTSDSSKTKQECGTCSDSNEIQSDNCVSTLSSFRAQRCNGKITSDSEQTCVNNTQFAIQATGRICLISEGQTLHCMGKNEEGVLGDGTETDSFDKQVAVDLATNINVVQVSTGVDITCAVTDASELYCWGSNENGLLAEESSVTKASTPHKVSIPAGMGTVKHVEVNEDRVCATNNSDQLFCWGKQSEASLGTAATDAIVRTPTQVTLPASLTVKEFHVSDLSICAVLSDDKFYCWGKAFFNGLGEDKSVPTEVPLPTGTKISQFDMGKKRTSLNHNASHCAVLDNGKLYCFGYGPFGATTLHEVSTLDLAALPTSNKRCMSMAIRDVTYGGSSSNTDLENAVKCKAYLDDLDTMCIFGAMRYNLYDSTTVTCDYPVRVKQETNNILGTDIDFHIDDVGQCWPCLDTDISSYSGATDDTTTQTSHQKDGTSFLFAVPTNMIEIALPNGKTAVKVSVGQSHACVELSDKNLYCWGDKDSNYQGDGTATLNTKIYSPVRLPSLQTSNTVVKKVAGTANSQMDHSKYVSDQTDEISMYTCVILTDDTVRCYGTLYDQSGQLGTEDTVNRNPSDSTKMGLNLMPLDFGLGKTPKELFVGADFSCALFTDDTTKCWGDNPLGLFGKGVPIGKFGDRPGTMGENLPTANFGANKIVKQIAMHCDRDGSTKNMIMCIIFTDNTLKCAGRPSRGKYSPVIGKPADQYTFDSTNGLDWDTVAEIDLGTDVYAKQISLAARHACAITNNDKLKCWGYGWGGALGYGDTTDRGGSASTMGDNLDYHDFGTEDRVKQVVVDGQISCVILFNDKIKCWGWQFYGALPYSNIPSSTGYGDSSTETLSALAYADFGSGRTATQMACAYPTCMVLLDNGQVKHFGAVDDQAYDYVSSDSDPVLVTLPPGKTAKAVSVGSSMYNIVLNDDTIVEYSLYWRLLDSNTQTYAFIDLQLPSTASSEMVAFEAGQTLNCVQMETDADALALINERCPEYHKTALQLTCAVDASSGGKFNGTGADCTGEVTASYVEVCTPTKRHFCVTESHDAGDINSFSCSNQNYNTEDTCGSCSDTSKTTKATCVDHCPTGLPQADCGICSQKCSTEISAGDDVRSVAIADMNGDGKDDVLVASFNDDTIAWYKRKDDGTFEKNDIATDCDGAIKVIGLDWDHDNDVDVIAYCKNGDSTTGNAKFYTNDGTGTFTYKTSFEDSPDQYNYKPLQHSGAYKEFLCGSKAVNKIMCVFHTGNTGYFEFMDISGANLAVLSGNSEFKTMGHTRSVKNFIRLGKSGTSQLIALQSGSSGSYVQIIRYNDLSAIGYSTSAVSLSSNCYDGVSADFGDMDSDGNEDLVVLCDSSVRWWKASQNPSASSDWTYQSTKKITISGLTSLNTAASGQYYDEIRVVDYNGDGKNDVMWTRTLFGNAGKSSILINDGTGTFTEQSLNDLDTPIEEIVTVGNLIAVAHGTDDKFTYKEPCPKASCTGTFVSTWQTATWSSEWVRTLENDIGIKVKRKTCSVDAVSGNFDGTDADCSGTITETLSDKYFSSKQVSSRLEPLSCAYFMKEAQPHCFGKLDASQTAVLSPTRIGERDFAAQLSVPATYRKWTSAWSGDLYAKNTTSDARTFELYTKGTETVTCRSLESIDPTKLAAVGNLDVTVQGQLQAATINGIQRVDLAQEKSDAVATDCAFVGQFIQKDSDVYVCTSTTAWVQVN